jgi:gamma-glutamylcyclotransferase
MTLPLSRLYFAYGANLNRESMSWRCPRAQPLRAVYLRDWQLTFATHATIQPRIGAQVAGALWQITPECESSLDAFEGYPVYYDKQYIDIDGEEVMIYVMNSPRAQAPMAGYLATVAQGYSDWELDPESLWQAVKSTEEIEDDLYRSRTGSIGNAVDLDRGLSGLDLGHELRDLRDMETSHSHR